MQVKKWLPTSVKYHVSELYGRRLEHGQCHGCCWLLNLLLAEFSHSCLQVVLSLIPALETIASSEV